MKENELREILQKLVNDAIIIGRPPKTEEALSQIIDLIIGKVKREINSVIVGLRDTSDNPDYPSDKDYNQGLEMARKAILTQLKTILKGLK